MIEDLTPRQVAERLDTDAPPLLLDVREDWERQVASIDGSAHIPMGAVPGRFEELPEDRDIVVICHHGNRSRVVAEWLAQRGITRVTNLAGGIDAWASELDPDIPRYH